MSRRRTAYMWDPRMLGHRPATRFNTEHPRRLEAISPEALAESVPRLVRPSVNEYGGIGYRLCLV